MAAWRKAGLTYNTYLSVAARTVRAALKPELQDARVLARSKTDARYVKYEKGSAASDPVPLQE